MSAKHIGLWTLFGILIATATARADDVFSFPRRPGAAFGASSSMSMPTPPGLPDGVPIDPPAPVVSGPGPVGGEATPMPQLSNWITGTPRPGCCGPVGAHGPINTELYLRTGLSLPIQGAIFGRTLDPGWAISGGWRSLFFDASDTSAWTIDLGITNICNGGRNPDILIPLRNILVPDPSQGGFNASEVSVPLVGVTVRALNRTFVNLGFGKEWYLLGTAHDPGMMWRVGVDAGGRWGSASLRTYELPHRNDVIGGAWASVHSDVEVPYGGFIFMGGLRFEWDYTWSDILQIQNNSDMQDVNLMISGGIRF